MNTRIRDSFLSKLRQVIAALGDAECLFYQGEPYPYCDTSEVLRSVNEQLKRIVQLKGGNPNGTNR